jgi:hypothetical protein
MPSTRRSSMSRPSRHSTITGTANQIYYQDSRGGIFDSQGRRVHVPSDCTMDLIEGSTARSRSRRSSTAINRYSQADTVDPRDSISQRAGRVGSVRAQSQPHYQQQQVQGPQRPSPWDYHDLPVPRGWAARFGCGIMALILTGSCDYTRLGYGRARDIDRMIEQGMIAVGQTQQDGIQQQHDYRVASGSVSRRRSASIASSRRSSLLSTSRLGSIHSSSRHRPRESAPVLRRVPETVRHTNRREPPPAAYREPRALGRSSSHGRTGAERPRSSSSRYSGTAVDPNVSVSHRRHSGGNTYAMSRNNPFQ